MDQTSDPFVWSAPDAFDQTPRRLEMKPHGIIALNYQGHSDPSKVNCNFAIAIAHAETCPYPTVFPELNNEGTKIGEKVFYFPHVMIDYMHVYKPEDFPDHTLDYVQIQRDLELLIGKFPSLENFTFDQFNSQGFIANLKRAFPTRPRIYEATFTAQSNQNRFEKFKSAINLGWVHSYRDEFFGDGESLLENELKFLQNKNGRVVHQTIGPVTTKDLADCVMEVTTRLLGRHLDQWKRELLNNTPVVGGLSRGYPKAGSGIDAADTQDLNNKAAQILINGQKSNLREALTSYKYARGQRAAYQSPTRGRAPGPSDRRR